MILDEPTAALGVAQTGMVLALVRRLAHQGYGVLIVSHNLNDVSKSPTTSPFCAWADGGTGPAAQLDRQSVVG